MSTGTKHKVLAFFLTCGCVGYIPGAPGTYASLLCCLFLMVLPPLSPGVHLAFLLFLCGAAVLSIDRMGWGKDDPGFVVIDEFAGMWITLAGHSLSLVTVGLGFALFRFFDIIKPYPVRQAEALQGGMGVMADDVAAGIYANLLLHLGRTVWSMVT